MPDLKTIVRAARLKLLIKILSEPNEQWKCYLECITCLDKEYAEKYYTLKAGVTLNSIPIFYKECIEAVRFLREHQPIREGKEDLLNQYLWGNPHIRIQGQPVYDKIWCKSGIKYVHDILDTMGNIKYDCIENKIVQKASIILKLNKLMGAIPRIWKDTLQLPGTVDISGTVRQSNMFMELGIAHTYKKSVERKVLYQWLLPKIVLSQCEQYWQNKFGDVAWHSVYNLHKNHLLERKMKEFRWKTLNKCLATENKIKHFAESDGI